MFERDVVYLLLDGAQTLFESRPRYSTLEMCVCTSSGATGMVSPSVGNTKKKNREKRTLGTRYQQGDKVKLRPRLSHFGASRRDSMPRT